MLCTSRNCLAASFTLPFAILRPRVTSSRSLLAGGCARAGPDVVADGRLRVADRAADLDVARPVTAEARLGQPREADAKQVGGLSGQQQSLDLLSGLADRVLRRL